MIFGPDLIDKVLDGSKTVTRRRLVHRNGRPLAYKEGGVYAVQWGRGKRHVGHIRVLSITEEPLARMDDTGEATQEGFSSPGDFFDYWRKLHGAVDLGEIVAVIRFELAKMCDGCGFW